MAIEVLHSYGGALTKERRIQPGIYNEDDNALFGLADYLVENGHARRVEQTTTVTFQGDETISGTVEVEETPPAWPDDEDNEVLYGLSTIEGLTERHITALQDAGYYSVEDLQNANVAELERIDGIGPAAMEALWHALAGDDEDSD